MQHAFGKLTHLALMHVVETDTFELFFEFMRVVLAQPRVKQAVLPNRALGIQRNPFGHVSEFATVAIANALPTQQHFASASGKSARASNRTTCSCRRHWAEQRQHAPLLHLDRDLVQRDDFAETFLNAFKF